MGWFDVMFHANKTASVASRRGEGEACLVVVGRSLFHNVRNFHQPAGFLSKQVEKISDFRNLRNFERFSAIQGNFSPRTGDQ